MAGIGSLTAHLNTKCLDVDKLLRLAFAILLRAVPVSSLIARLVVVAPLCAFGGAVFAQDLQPPPALDQPADSATKSHAKKTVHKTVAGKSAKPTSEDSDKASRLEEGRKKFFERSMGFDNGSSGSSNVTLSNENGGISPAMGLKF
jgi:hypothetical protein